MTFLHPTQKNKSREESLRDEIERLKADADRPWLGLATTRELLDELRARIEMHALGGLAYRTVDGEKIAEAAIAPCDDADVADRKSDEIHALRTEVERMRAERAGDQQRLFHYEAEIERLRALLRRHHIRGAYWDSELAVETRAALEPKP